MSLPKTQLVPLDREYGALHFGPERHFCVSIVTLLSITELPDGSHPTNLKYSCCQGLSTQGARLRAIRAFMFYVSLKVRSLYSFTTVVVGTILSFRRAGQTVLLYGNEKQNSFFSLSSLHILSY